MGTVGAGEQGVLLKFGAVTEEIKDEGLYFKVPFMHQVVMMSMQIQKYTAPATSSSKDLQVVVHGSHLELPVGCDSGGRNLSHHAAAV